MRAESQSSAAASDALLDALVWDTDVTAINPLLYPVPLRTEIERFLRRSMLYRSRREISATGEMRMVQMAQVRYERRLSAASTDENSSAMAADYVDRLRPCYEWEGFHGCPEHEAMFADEYQAGHPDGPFSAYLPLLAAHRWLCAAEAYQYELKPADAERSRNLAERRLIVARASKVLMIRTAAERLSMRRSCFAPR